MRILAISGSLREGSTNTAILRAMATLGPAGAEWEFYSGLAALPHFDTGIDIEPAPPPVAALRRAVAAADAVIFCTPEYAFGIPGSLKNALDWLVSSGEFDRKPVAALSASPTIRGGDRALDALLLTLQALGTRVPEGGSLAIPAIRKKVGAKGEVADPGTLESLRKVVDALAAEAARPGRA